MSKSSIESEFTFLSYKIGSFLFRMEKLIALLLIKENFNPDDIQFQVAIHPPFYFKPQQVYICGLSCRVFFNRAIKETEKGKEVVPSITETEKEEEGVSPFFELSASIDGAFQTKDKTRFPSELEDTLVKLQAPTILFPFLRSSIISFFANAGFGSIMLPLVNVNKIAEMQKDKLEIKEID